MIVAVPLALSCVTWTRALKECGPVVLKLYTASITVTGNEVSGELRMMPW